MAHSDRIKRIYKNRMLRTSVGFAERGHFARRNSPKSKKPLTTSVTLARSKSENDQTRKLTTRIEVFFMRDESDADVGGVQDLRSGDLYFRDPKFDADSRPYSFTDEIIEQGQNYTRAVFQRFENASQGRSSR